MRLRVLRPERRRQLERPFSWLPFRLVTAGVLGELSAGAALLYFFLCLVADRDGLSYWSLARMAVVLNVAEVELARAREELCAHDLLAYDDGLYQVLSLPPRGAAGARHGA